MASLFFEPSTRTNFSFQSAMLRLGGGVFGFNDPNLTSVTKGESLKDSMIMISGYSDVIVCRHPHEGAAMAASLYSSCPVVNAGDGGHLHPTQTLTDLAAITSLRGTVEGLTVGLCGDLKNGRTVHSLIRALGLFGGVSLYLISPDELTVPEYLLRYMENSGLRHRHVRSLEPVIGELDVLYMTRIQRERFRDPKEYERHRGVYILNGEKLAGAKKDLIVLHPLPRVDEISPEVDSDPRAAYFLQARCGMYVRMALLLRLSLLPAEFSIPPHRPSARVCSNPNCVTAFESYLPPLSEDGRCGYCEQPVFTVNNEQLTTNN
jgi:aspartate carbamoyltransferase catalytic subunit